MRLLPLEWIVFDPVETLLRSEPPEPERLRSHFASAGIELDDIGAREAHLLAARWEADELLSQAGGRPGLASDQFARRRLEAALHAVLGEQEASEAADRLSAMAAPACSWRPDPEAEEALSLLRSCGCRVVVVGPATLGLDASLTEHGLAQLVEYVALAEHPGRGGHDPSALTTAVRRLGCPPDRTAYVGTHALDVWGAHHAGVRAVWVAGRPEPRWRYDFGLPHHIIGRLIELSGLVQRLRAL